MTEVASTDVHLDTSFLIRALVRGSAESDALRRWLREGRSVAISTIVWAKFLCGPLESHVADLARRVARTHVSLETEPATTAARLFNETGRRRGSFQDCLVAATAITAGAPLATSDRKDFERFEAAGLVLVD